jgi:hypothetical protein
VVRRSVLQDKCNRPSSNSPKDEGRRKYASAEHWQGKSAGCEKATIAEQAIESLLVSEEFERSLGSRDDGGRRGAVSQEDLDRSQGIKF